MSAAIQNILLFVAGLAFTLFGMHMMSGGLERLSGGKLERALAAATASKSRFPIVGRLKGMLVGCGVTALVQSSSATTVMTVGFVNSGILKLEQAVGIIMGANIGTTITTWLLALTGLDGSAWYIQIFKPSTFSPILAVVGAGLILFCKQQKRKNIGTTLVSFAILMFGMSQMSSVCGQLAGNALVADIFSALENPILGILAGAIFTGIIQASAATLAIVQALAASGSISYGAAIPIILGSNIGTCVTAILSCIGAGTNAKRTAMVHLYFNIIGSLFFMCAFYLLNAIFHFDFLSKPLNAADIAIIHTIFNVSATALLLPLGGLLAKAAKFTIKDKPSAVDKEASRLDQRFLHTPAIALEQCRIVAGNMAAIVRRNLSDALGLFDGYTETSFDKVQNDEETVDGLEDKLGTYLVQVCAQQLDEDESREANLLLHSIGDFERISDHAVNLSDSAQEMKTKSVQFSDAARAELNVIRDALYEIVDLSFTAWQNNNVAMAQRVEPLEEVIDLLQQELKDRHILRLQAGECTIAQGFVFNDVLANIERVADHCSNVAVGVIESQGMSMDSHRYLNAEKEAPSEQFRGLTRSYLEKYKLD